jgi:PP-loop superfamily ATP-utilizing enzyme
MLESKRIKLPKESKGSLYMIARILNDNFAKIVSYFKELGFVHVTIDLEGFRSGSLNEALT